MAYQAEIEAIGRLELPWQKLAGTNVLVTGATGLIGSCLVDVLMSREGRDYCVWACGRNEVRARERFGRYAEEDGFWFVKQDVMEPLALDVDFAYIIHAAGGASPNCFGQRPVEVIKENIVGLSHVMDYGLQHGMRRLLYLSTGEVYGEGDGRSFSEDYQGRVDCRKARACYPASKRAAETLCAAYGAEYGAEVVVARPTHVYGPHFTESDNRVYAQMIRNARRGEDIVLKSAGTQVRSWCYVVDCAAALLYILLCGEAGETYNVADNASNCSIRQLAETIAEAAGRKVVFETPSDAEAAAFNPVTRSLFDTSKIERLGWRPQGRLEDNILSTLLG